MGTVQYDGLRPYTFKAKENRFINSMDSNGFNDLQVDIVNVLEKGAKPLGNLAGAWPSPVNALAGVRMFRMEI
jgi:hypothetical protein